MSASSAVPIADSTMINVVGHETPYPYSKVKDAILNLGGVFYFKHDSDNLVRVKDSSGKKKYFRKKSKLIYEISPGKFIHKSFLIRTEDGILLDKSDPNTIVIDGKLTKKDYAVEINGKYYLRTNPQVHACALTGNFCLKSEMLQLHPKYYTNMYVSPTANGLIKISDGLITVNDARLLLDTDGNEVYYHRAEIKGTTINDIFHKFRDATNPQLDRIDFIHMLATDAKEHTVMHEELGIRIHKNHLEKFNQTYQDVILLRSAAEADAIKKALKYADDGPDENQAKMVKKIPQPWPGKYNIFTPSDMSPVISRKCDLLGGLKYTFGIEIETAQGLLGNPTAEKLKTRIVGDRSIGAGEYVSTVLHGNDGMLLVKKMCTALSKYCFVDDKCGFHVHIGGMSGIRGVADGGFDRHFAQYAVSLGAQIEPELFATCPESRKPTLKHCHSIMRWKDINDKNWREYLGAFVFGPEENWKEPWSFAPYTYGKGSRTRQNKLGDFCGGRYKWLNLVHILSKSSFNTCELRLFPGTTNFEKMYAYIMLSMAFVWFIENKTNRIVKGDVTLNEVLTAPFKKYPEISKRLVDFYEARKQRFNRKNLYPSTIPNAIF